MRIQIFKVAVLLISTLTFASGGNTSGGGDVYGMNEFAIAIQATKKAILESKKEIYTRAQMRKLKKLFGMKLLVGASDAAHFEKDHAVEVAGITQVGSAHSVFSWNERSEHAEMVINKDEWIKAPDRAAQMGLLNHEFCVLTGIEATGDYNSKVFNLYSQTHRA